MKKLILITSFLILGFINHLQAQFTQVELFSGLDKTDFTLFSNYSINEKNNLQISTLAFFQRFHERADERFSEVGVQPTLFWSVDKSFSVGPSLYYNSIAGYSGRLSSKFTLKQSRLLLVIIPTIAYSEQANAGYAEAFAQFQFNSPINEKVSLWFNGQFLTVWDKFKSHSRSFQQLRAGVYLNGHQFGFGLDFDQYGPNPIEQIIFRCVFPKNFIDQF